jgi:hypothetical protein
MKPPASKRISLMRRLIWLLVCTALGLGTGFVGHYFTANAAWFMALPMAIAIGWLFLANPAECLPSHTCHNDDDATS